jgi:(R,R)-butanediol dehydrogenase/meso-butanediol dehydrogenase/diacetyl reductase
MQAARFYGVGDLRFETVPVPALAGPHDVRVRVLAAGICGSDLHNFRTGQWISRLPVTPGHEFAGVVIESADASFAPGDIVVADSRAFCGGCAACQAGRFNLCENLGFVGEVCDGGFAEQTVLPAHGLYHVPHGIPPAIAALSEPLAVALHAINVLAPVHGQPVLVAGGGPIGGLICLLLKEFGHGPIYLVERNPFRAGLLAEVAGAQSVDFFSAKCPPFGYAIDASGSTAIVEALLGKVAAGGTVALVGLFHGGLNIDLNRLVEREIKLRGCSVFESEMANVLPMLAQLAPALTRISSAPIGVADIPGAYQHLIAGDTKTLKTIIQP